MSEVPVIVYDKFKVHGQVELVFYQFVQFLCIHIVASHAVVQPAANADVEAVGLLVEEDASAGDEGVVMLLIEDGTGVALGLGAVVLLLPVGLVEFPNGGTAIDECGLLCIHFLHTEERLIGHVVPEDAELGLTVVEERRHRVDEALMLLAVGVVDPVVVLCHVIDNVYRVLYALKPRFGFYCGLLFFYGQLSPIVADAPRRHMVQ